MSLAATTAQPSKLPALTTPQRIELAHQDFTAAVGQLRPPQDAPINVMAAITKVDSGIKLLGPIADKVPPARSALGEALEGQSNLISLAFTKPATQAELDSFLTKIDIAAGRVEQAAAFLAPNSR